MKSARGPDRPSLRLASAVAGCVSVTAVHRRTPLSRRETTQKLLPGFLCRFNSGFARPVGLNRKAAVWNCDLVCLSGKLNSRAVNMADQ